MTDMNILIAGLHHRVGTARYMTDAFERLGHDTRHIGYLPGNDNPADSNRWLPQGDWHKAWEGWTPDLVLYIDTIYHTYQHNVYGSVPHVTVCTCNNVCNMSTTKHAHYFVAHKHSEEWPLEGPDMSWMPCGYDPALHTPSPIAWSKREYDIAVVGAGTDPRREYVAALREAGLSVLFESGVYFEAYVDAYHNSRMSLCVNVYKSPMMRYFESAAMGCLIIGDNSPDLVDLKARGMVGVDSAVEAVEQAQYYLAHAKEANAMIKQAQRWAARKVNGVPAHSWDARAQQIVDWYKEAYGG